MAIHAIPDTDELWFRDTVRRYVAAPRFVRRDWLADEILAALAGPGCQMVLLTGEPGAGKSGLLAQLADEQPTWPRYFIRRDQGSRISAGTAHAFLLRVGFQLAAAFPQAFAAEQIKLVVEQRIGRVNADGSAVAAEVRRILASPFHQAVVRVRQEVAHNAGDVVGLRVGEWVSDPRSLAASDLAAMALLDPARALAALNPADRVVVLLDALDELPYTPEDQTLLSWLAGVDLPENVRLVLASREEPMLRTLVDRQGDRLVRIRLDEADRRVRNDLVLVARPVAAAAGVPAGGDRDAFVDRLVAKADGNIGYLDAFGRAVDQAAEDPALMAELLAFERLPRHLYGLYALFLRQLRTGPGARLVRVEDPATGLSGRAEAWTELFHPMLEVLCVAREPLTMAQLSGLSGTQAGDADTVAAVQRLSQFLDRAGADRYRLYHATLADFLTADETLQQPETADVAVDPVAAHQRLGARLRTDLWNDPPDPAGLQSRAYGRRHYLAHLFDGRLWDELFSVLDAGDHGRHRLRADPSAQDLWADLELGRRASVRDASRDESVRRLPNLWRYSPPF